MIPLTNHDFQRGRSEVVVTYPEYMEKHVPNRQPVYHHIPW